MQSSRDEHHDPCMHCHQHNTCMDMHNICTMHAVYIGLLVAAVMPEVLGVNTEVNCVVVVVVESVVVNPVIVFVESVVPPVEDVLPGDVPKSQVVVVVLEDDPDTYSVGCIYNNMNSNYVHLWVAQLTTLIYITRHNYSISPLIIQMSTKCSPTGIVVGTLVILHACCCFLRLHL